MNIDPGMVAPVAATEAKPSHVAYPDPAAARVAVFIAADGTVCVLLDGVDRTKEIRDLTISVGAGKLPEVQATFFYLPKRKG